MNNAEVVPSCQEACMHDELNIYCVFNEWRKIEHSYADNTVVDLYRCALKLIYSGWH